MKRLWLCPLVAALVAGCGGTGAKGTASVWITRDRGAHVLLAAKVPAGTTAMQALDRVAEIKTRYGGRFVQSINGIEGSLSGRRDWFYFVNGYEADRSAAEYVLHPGDVEWWDFRSWRGGAKRVPVVVGAFPEPFLHGYGGKRRPAEVVYTRLAQRPAATKLAAYLHARVRGPDRPPAPFGSTPRRSGNVPNALVLVPGPSRFVGAFPPGLAAAGDPVVFLYGGDAARLAREPEMFRYRYRVASP